MKAQMLRKLKNGKGITLIALVVTIVVLIILATISIQAVFGENGLIKTAQEAKELHEQKQQEELEGLNGLDEYLGTMLNENSGGGTTPELPDITPTTPAGTEVKKPSTWDSEKVIAIADGKGGLVALPDGYYYVGGDIDTGIVISDKQGDTIDASGVDMGSQFVWIPVSDESKLERTEFDSNGQPTTGLDTVTFTEPYASGYSGEDTEYNTMRTQVLKYGGFFIGRFEAGVNSTTLRTDTTTAQPVVSKRGVAPYNYVPWGTSMSDASEVSGQSGAVYLAKNMYTHPDSVESTLCYGSQWDAMCRYIGDGQRTTPTKSAPELTGSVSTDVSKNIYDLAGNCWEWTMEADGSNVRVRRGGFYDYDMSVSNRGSDSPNVSGDYIALRGTLYVK